MKAQLTVCESAHEIEARLASAASGMRTAGKSGFQNSAASVAENGIRFARLIINFNPQERNHVSRTNLCARS